MSECVDADLVKAMKASYYQFYKQLEFHHIFIIADIIYFLLPADNFLAPKNFVKDWILIEVKKKIKPI